jgi:type VI protein secretion system component VasF
MTLLELTEPVFQYICRLNRLARRSGAARGDTMSIRRGAAGGPGGTGFALRSLDYSVVRAEVKGLFDDMAQKAAGDNRLAAQFKLVEMPLLFFVDSMISESRLTFADQWNQKRLAYEKKELAGDQKFFDLLEDTLKDPSEEASERLAVFYTCLGIGFTGFYFNQPEYLRKTMLTIAPRIRRLMETDKSAKVCPEAYENVDTRNLVQPPGSRLIFVGILFVCFMLAVIFAYGWMYRSAAKDLKASIAGIEEHNPGPAPKQ